MHKEVNDFSPEDRSDDTQYEAELQCTSCRDICLADSCMGCVETFGATGVQYFCELDENFWRDLTAARSRQRSWKSVNNQGHD